MTVRAASPADLDELDEVYRRASLSNAGDRKALLEHPEVQVFAGEELATGGTTAAVVEGQIVGFSTVVGQGAIWELTDLFVDPDWMRRGIGRRLIVDALDRVTAAGGSVIEVTANDHAAAFYAAVGFAWVGTAVTQFGDAPRLRMSVGGPV